MDDHHPFRNATINVYALEDGNTTPFIAFINALPVKFSGDTAEAVRSKAQAFIDDAIATHEAEHQRRMELRRERAAKKQEAQP